MEFYMFINNSEHWFRDLTAASVKGQQPGLENVIEIQEVVPPRETAPISPHKGPVQASLSASRKKCS